jgi:hypothetical protein
MGGDGMSSLLLLSLLAVVDIFLVVGFMPPVFESKS